MSESTWNSPARLSRTSGTWQEEESAAAVAELGKIEGRIKKQEDSWVNERKIKQKVHWEGNKRKETKNEQRKERRIRRRAGKERK